MARGPQLPDLSSRLDDADFFEGYRAFWWGATIYGPAITSPKYPIAKEEKMSNLSNLCNRGWTTRNADAISFCPTCLTFPTFSRRICTEGNLGVGTWPKPSFPGMLLNL
jgi:hypothetical protein